MLQNYLITALRNFTRHKLYSFINIAGLTVGLTCAIFIILFVRDQLSYDKWIPETENLYRVEQTFSLPGQSPSRNMKIPMPVTQAMLEQIPEVRARTRLTRNHVTVLAGSRQFPETLDSVDPNFFRVIKLPLVAGDPASVFVEPDSVVLSQARARKYFGSASALGKTIVLDADYCDQQGMNCQLQQHPLTVTGIFRDLPHNTQLAADLVIPFTSKADPTGWNTKTNWLNTSGWGYVLLAPQADPSRVSAALRTIIDHSVDVRQLMKINLRGSEVISPHLTPFRDDHLSSDKYGSSMTPAGSWTTVYGFMAIGVLILLVACFNFTNLATARAIVRAREISLRKVVGAARSQLIVQFLGESVLIALIALVLAFAFSEMLMPLFDRFVNAPIGLHYLHDWPVLLLMTGIGVAVGLLSGAYPALVLSGVRPGLVLRSSSPGQSGSGLLRTSLVVLQFAVSIGLAIAVLVVSAQISFARHVDLGFHKDGLLVINAETLSTSEKESFANALRSNHDIAAVTISDQFAIPFLGDNRNDYVSVPGNPSTFTFWLHSVGPDYPRVYGVRLIAGRLLSEQHGGDIVRESSDGFPAAPYNILVNQTGARMLGYSAESALGKIIKVHGTSTTIVGVIEDVKMEGANKFVGPFLYRYAPTDGFHWISMRVRGPHLAQTLAIADRTWHAFAPNVVIERHFLNDDFEKQFLADERQGDIFGIFVGIAIFIACLGLFGLAAFSTERRTREIGVRKAFGAQTMDIVLMLVWQFSIPVLVANVIAWPVTYYYLHDWLENYAYRITLNPLYFVGSGLAALLIAWATVIVHAAHVARANPIHALRYE